MPPWSRLFLVCAALAGAAGCATDEGRTETNAPAVQLADAGDAARGRTYAEESCASCHAIEAGEASPLPIAPSFEDVANTPGMTAIAIRAWLNSPHPNMPNLIIEPERADDLAAYIISLERRD